MKKRYSITLILLIFIFLTFSSAYTAIKLYDAVMYFIDSSPITFQWDPPVGATPTGYEVELKCIDTNQIYKKTSTITSVTYSRPRSGHFILYVRSYTGPIGPGRIYSPWVSSDSPDQQIWIDGKLKRQGGWILYWRTPVPTN